MSSLFEELPKEERAELAEEEIPSNPSPMLAVLVDEAFSDPDWIFERKFDGERALCVLTGGEARLLSRNGKDLGSSYPEIVEALETEVADDLLGDGEIVAFDDGITSFSRLQKRMQITDPKQARESSVGVYYYLFDLIHLQGRDLRALPLRTRKRLLRKALDFADPLRFSQHRNEDGEAYLREACHKGWEGIMAKEAGSPYEAGRSRAWQKFKCVARQELVLGGFTEPGGSRRGFGALLVGYYEEGGEKLRYAGKVGTGFDEETLGRLARRMKRLERKTPPFSRQDRRALPSKGVHWITPNLVGDFGFTEWTSAGRLRHPRFLGLRRDKDPEDVTRERAQGQDP